MRTKLCPLPTQIMLAFSVTLGQAAQLRAAPPPSKEAVRAELMRYWDALSTISFHAEDCLVDAHGNPDRSKGSNHYDFAMSTDGHIAFKIYALSPSGEIQVIQREYQDDRRVVSIVPFKSDPDSIDQVTITSRQGAPDTYAGSMSPQLWFLLPKGRPLFSHLAKGALIDRQRVSSGKEDAVVLEINDGKRVRCRLDPSHDWLPDEIDFGPTLTYRVKRFGRDNGFWFPLEIVVRRGEGKNSRQSVSLVSELRINRGIPASRLQPPPIPQGAIVEDRTKRHGEIRGGVKARKALESRFAVAAKSDATMANRPVSASREPPKVPWAQILAGLSATVFGAAILVARRRPGQVDPHVKG